MENQWPKQVKIVEVGPRDGLQHEKKILSVAERVKFINLLSESGLKSIEVGSIVSPKWVPQMEDSARVFERIKKLDDVDYILLVPNRKGFEIARDVGAKSIAIFTAASEAFSLKNTNCSIEESLDRFSEFLSDARSLNMRIRGYVSCALGCPYEGEISPDRVASVALSLLDLGVDEISLGDTIGVGTPEKVQALLDAMIVPKEKLAVHFHDTHGRAIENIRTSLNNGISIIDSSIAGLGGCPYANGATGNVSTEKVIDFLESHNIKTGIDHKKLEKAREFVSGVV